MTVAVRSRTSSDAGQLERDARQRGDALGRPLLVGHRRRQLLGAGEQVGLDREHAPSSSAVALPLGLPAVALGDEVGDVLRALGDEDDAALGVADRAPR